MNIGQWLSEATQELKRAGIASARLDALLLLENVIGKEKSWLLAHADDEIARTDALKLSTSVNRRLKHEPIAYITGEREFYGLPVMVTRDTLIPRPETESLAEHAILHCPRDGSLLDIGTGSGAIALAVKHNRPDISVTASDISTKTLSVAQQNAAELRLDIHFVLSDMFENIAEHRFDVICANLPYLPNDYPLSPDVAYEPEVALTSGEDGAYHYRQLFAALPKYLQEDGFCLIEHSPEQDELIHHLAQQNRLNTESITKFVTKLTLS